MKKPASALLNRIEFPVLLAGLVIAGGLWGFEELMEVARSSTPHAFDTEILLAFSQVGQPDVPIGPLWLQGTMRDITSLSSSVVLALITVAAIAYLLLIRRPGVADLRSRGGRTGAVQPA